MPVPFCAPSITPSPKPTPLHTPVSSIRDLTWSSHLQLHHTGASTYQPHHVQLQSGRLTFGVPFHASHRGKWVTCFPSLTRRHIRYTFLTYETRNQASELIRPFLLIRSFCVCGVGSEHRKPPHPYTHSPRPCTPTRRAHTKASPARLNLNIAGRWCGGRCGAPSGVGVTFTWYHLNRLPDQVLGVNKGRLHEFRIS